MNGMSATRYAERNKKVWFMYLQKDKERFTKVNKLLGLFIDDKKIYRCEGCGGRFQKAKIM